ncbi:MAG: leucyl/phenylalanyl-tRNA--protein transferase [Bacteroidales bacterium]|jgi:leucyl/phenylalanyl-tRNA--protein transferase
MAFEIQFPDPNEADDDGLAAVGGNLSSDYLLSAYSQGIFPWFNEGDPILWWSPNPRMILYPDKFKCSGSLKQIIKKKVFTVKVDTNFEKVIRECATVERPGQKGTWITKDMTEAYINLHDEGYAHSVETYLDDTLAGGLYGVSLGKTFFGESMFHHVANASKVALYYLTELMQKWNFQFIDVQQSTDHMRRLGAVDVDRSEFLMLLKESVSIPARRGKWKMESL